MRGKSDDGVVDFGVYVKISLTLDDILLGEIMCIYRYIYGYSEREGIPLQFIMSFAMDTKQGFINC